MPNHLGLKSVLHQNRFSCKTSAHTYADTDYSGLFRSCFDSGFFGDCIYVYMARNPLYLMLYAKLQRLLSQKRRGSFNNSEGKCIVPCVHSFDLTCEIFMNLCSKKPSVESFLLLSGAFLLFVPAATVATAANANRPGSETEKCITAGSIFPGNASQTLPEFWINIHADAHSRITSPAFLNNLVLGACKHKRCRLKEVMHRWRKRGVSGERERERERERE